MNTNENKTLYLNNVSDKLIRRKVFPGGEECMYVNFACPKSADGYGSFRADVDQVFPAKKKSGEVIEGRSNIRLGEPEAERNVSITESVGAGGKKKYATIKMTNEQIFAAYEAEWEEWRSAHRAAEPAAEQRAAAPIVKKNMAANETKDLFLSWVSEKMIRKWVSEDGEEFMYFNFACPESASGYGSIRVNMDQVLPDTDSNGEVNKKLRRVILGKPEAERSVRIAESFNEDGETNYTRIKMTNAQIFAAIEAYWEKRRSAQRAAAPAAEKGMAANTTKDLFLYFVSNKRLCESDSADGEFINVSFTCSESANGLGDFGVNKDQVLPATNKDGKVTEGFSHIILGKPWAERSVSIIESINEYGGPSYKTIKMTNEQIAASNDFDEWVRAQRTADDIFINNVSCKLLKERTASHDGHKFMSLSFDYPESANGVGSFLVNMEHVLPAVDNNGEVVEGYVNIWLGNAEGRRKISFVESIDANNEYSFGGIRMTNAQVAALYEAHRQKQIAAASRQEQGGAQGADEDGSLPF